MAHATLDAPAAPGGQSQLVTFLMGEEEFGFDIMSVQEIIRPPAVARVPGAPRYVDGVANLRGVVLPVLDMGTRLGRARAGDTDRTRVLVVDSGGLKTGLRVDAVSQVVRFQASDIEVPSDALRGGGGDGLRGVLQVDDGRRLVMVLDPERICSLGISRSPGGASPGLPEAAVSAPAPEAGGGASADALQVVAFTAGGTEFAIDLEHVREILRARPATRVPNVPAHVLGVLTVRGRVLPVVDLRRILGMGELDPEVRTGVFQEEQRIIVVDAGGLPLGVVVDQVREVLSVPRPCVEPPPPFTSKGLANVSGVARMEDGQRLILLLDGGTLLGETDLRALDAAGRRAEGGTVVSPDTKPAAAGASAGIQMVTFMLGAEEYGIPIAQIREIDRPARVTRIPNAPAFVDGVRNLRGEVIPVLDTRRRFDLPPKAPDDRTRVIIVELDGTRAGLVVDSVREVVTLAAGDITPPPEAAAATGAERFIFGIGRADQGARIIALLDVEQMVTTAGRRSAAGVERA